MVCGHMSCGVNGDRLMVRVGPEQYDDLLKAPHADEMDFTGKPMKEFLYVEVEAFRSEQDLNNWIELGIEHAESKL